MYVASGRGRGVDCFNCLKKEKRGHCWHSCTYVANVGRTGANAHNKYRCSAPFQSGVLTIVWGGCAVSLHTFMMGDGQTGTPIKTKSFFGKHLPLDDSIDDRGVKTSKY